MKEDTRPQPYSLRLEPETRAKLEASAKVAGRSLNAEIVMRLEASLREEERLVTEFFSVYEGLSDDSRGSVVDLLRRLVNETVDEKLKDINLHGLEEGESLTADDPYEGEYSDEPLVSLKKDSSKQARKRKG